MKYPQREQPKKPIWETIDWDKAKAYAFVITASAILIYFSR